MTVSTESETAVRNYLLFLGDPSRLIDRAELTEVEAAVKLATDPLEKLQLLNRVQQMRASDGVGYRQAFVTHAKAWADANGIQCASFVTLGVDRSTLRAAGFSLPGRGDRGAGHRPSRSSGRPRVRVDEVKAVVARQTGNFTLAELAVASGASPMTIRKAIDDLVATGAVERLGPTPNWPYQGRAPLQFRQAVTPPDEPAP